MRLSVAEPAHEPDLTVRALVSGLLVGALLCVANLYMGLKTGIWDSGHITAAILAFALLSGRLTRLETNVAQTAACAAGAVPAAAGLLGAIPALQLLGRRVPGWGIAAWGLSLGVLGILFAGALRRRLLEEEQLPFPSGVASAEVIEALHAGGAAAHGRTRTLLAGGVVGAVLGWLRDGRPVLVPGSLVVPGHLAGVPFEALGIGVSTSPLLWGVGMVVGPHIALSMLFGSVVAWAFLAPWLVRGPLHLAADRAALWSWLSWPGTALLVGAALVAILAQAGAFAGALRDLGSVARDRSRGTVATASLALAAALATVVLGKVVFDLRPAHTVLALLLSIVGASVCARSAGLTDISPLGPVGQLTQAVFGGLASGQPVVNIAAGSVVAGDATHTGVLLWSLRCGRALGAPVRGQVVAALLGCALGACVCVPAYALLTGAYGLGSAKLPVPTGVQWKAMGEVVAQGLGALPPGALPAVVAATAAGILLAALGTTRARSYVPSAVAVGIGVLVPVDYSLAIVCGSVVLTLGTRFVAPSWRDMGPVAGAGLIAGDSLIGIAAALLTSFGLL
jgi:putative OPT family oligopeptide transporter